MPDQEKINYCPLCGAHPYEHYEGEGDLLRWADQIVELYDQLQVLRSPEPETEVATDAH